MCPVLFALSAAFLAQTGSAPDAMALLTGVVNTAREAKSWRVEGNVAIENPRHGDSSRDFKLAWRAPALAHLESNGTVSGKTLMVCGEKTKWTYLPATNQYTAFERPTAENGSHGVGTWTSECKGLIGHWQHLLLHLVSATYLGRATVNAGGEMRGCENVRARYDTGRGIRTICIDADRLVILRERREMDVEGTANAPAAHWAATTTYSVAERDVELADSLFEFEPPAGSVELTHGVFGGPDITQPIPIYRPDPKFPKKTVRKRVEGTVVLSLVVGPDGRTYDVQVVKSLDPVLDKSAVEAVRTWEFQPGEKDGDPVSVMAKIEVKVHLGQKR